MTDTPSKFSLKEVSLLSPDIMLRLERNDLEKKMLAEFSGGLLNLKSKRQLLSAINTLLKGYLNFTSSTIFIAGRKEDLAYDFLGDEELTDSSTPFLRQVSRIDYAADEPVDSVDFTDYLSPEIVHAGMTGQVIGLMQEDTVTAWWVVYGDAGTVFNRQLLGLETVVNLLSSAVQKLREDQSAQERESETEILLSLNIDFASIRDKADLLQIIQYKLKKLFEFGHHWVAVINEDQLTMTSFLQDASSRARDHKKYKHMIAARYTTNDRIFNKVLLSKEPHVFDLDQLASRSGMPEYLEILHESGIKKVAMIGLQVGSRIIGIWAICLDSGQGLGTKQLSLIKSISSQLSISVDNIIANMAIQRKEKESALFLEFSFALTTISNKADLFKVIKTNVRKQFQFQDIIIMVGYEDRNIGNEIFLATTKVEDETDPYDLRIADSYFDEVLESGEIVILDDKKLNQGNTRKMICIGLNEHNYNICIFFLTDIKTDDYADRDLEIIRGVSYQLSSAVANILASEEIANRDKEKELLLALNLDIGAVRHSGELLQVINVRLKKFLGFQHVMITKINDDELTACTFLVDPASADFGQLACNEVAKKRFLLNDGIFNRCLELADPLVLDLEKLNNEMILPDYLKINFERGIRQVIVIKFSKGVRVFGFWLLFFDTRHPLSTYKFGLLQSLANQTSIAVFNIIANEEIARRDQEKTRLLSFSNVIASVRDKNLLAKLLKKQLFDLFGINEYVIHYLSQDKKTHTPVLFDVDAECFQLPEFQYLINRDNVVTDGIFDQILATNDPVFINVQEYALKEQCPDYLRGANALGLTEMIGISIRLGNENIAVMNFIHDDYNKIVDEFTLFKSILSQIALSVSNMMANERVNEQLEEINKYKLQLEEEKIYLKEEIETTLNYAEIVGESAVMQKTFRLVSQVASSDSTVLILGETGTGKELIARAIHNNSPRRSKLMVKVNCATLPANLIESELFGHERGSFTGATERRLGKFELANNGTLFLDEIGDMPLELQVKLLRALQEREIERVGGNTTIKVNVRVIAATNRDLEKEMAAGRFRSDLYYRLKIFPIELPPLRDRTEDIPLLATHFIKWFAKKAGKEIITLNSRAMQDLVNYKWPGNIRELEHLIERSVLLATSNTIRQVDLPAQTGTLNLSPDEEEFVARTIDENERDFILNTLKYCRGRIGGTGGAALVLGVPTSTLNSKMKRLGIRKEHII